MKLLLKRHHITNGVWYMGLISLFMLAPIGLKMCIPPEITIKTTHAEEVICDFKVSHSGNIYSKGDRYYSMTTHMTNLCENQAREISKKIKITIED